MQSLKSPGKGIGGVIAIFERGIRHKRVPLNEIESCQGQTPAPDIFRKRYTGQKRKHPAKMVFRALRQSFYFFKVNFSGEIFLDISQGLIHALQ